MYQFVANFSKKRIDYYPFGLKHSGYNSDQLMYIKQGTTTKIVPVPPLFTTSYQYKFNGKELQDELGLNMYDYQARNYDPALGRWMNVDPLAEKFPNVSPYAFCFNNPLRFVDPDGRAPNDHIFNANGVFLRDTKVGNAVKIEINGKLYSPSELSTSRGSRFAMSRIGAHYASKVGVDSGTKVTTGRSDMDSDKNAAYTTGKAISLNINGGFSKSLDNINDFKSVMKHENGHKEDNESPTFSSTLSTHADVYIGQMSDKSFGSTTDDFKVGIGSSFGNYLLNMDKGTDFGQSEIESKMDSFNSTNTAGMSIQRTGDNFGMHPQGTLDLELQYKGNTYPIKYEKIKE